MATPVVLVHGIDDTALVFGPMRKGLERAGLEVFDLDLNPPCGRVGLDVLAGQLAGFVERALPGRAFDLVGFSMGGVVGRYYLQRLGGLERARRFVSISSPHHGTLTAHLRPRAACFQMRPNSLFLNDLNRDVSSLAPLSPVSIWTPADLMIVPARSSVLPVGRSVRVLAPLHGGMVRDSRVIAAVIGALGSAEAGHKQRAVSNKPVPTR